MSGNDKGWKVAVVGECMATRPFSMHKEPDFLKIKNIINCADLCYGHLEMNFGKFEDVYPVRGNWVGSFLMTEPNVANDLKWLGIDMMSLANNHSGDYGPEAVISTIKACRDAGLVCAGTGANLTEATQAAYYESPAGRAALISTASGNSVNEWASDSSPSQANKAGINPLAAIMHYHVPEETAKALRFIGEHFNILLENEESFRFMTTSALTSCGEGDFSTAERYYIDSECEKKDLERNLNQIRVAEEAADLIMVAHHSNSAENNSRSFPPTYAVEFAHKAIDAGADIYFGHAWHKMLGIEIYKNKPIFYGLGNFFMQSHFLKTLPYDCFEARNIQDGSQMKGKPSENPHPGIKQPPHFYTLTSTVMELEFTADKRIKSMVFHPVELGIDLNSEGNPINRYTGNRNAEGRPMLAHGEGAVKILENLQKLCEPFGTHITIEGESGRWMAQED